MISLAISSSKCLRVSPLRNSFVSSLVAPFSSTPLPNAGKGSSKQPPPEPRDKWNYNSTSFQEKPSEQQLEYKLVDANLLEQETTPPRGVKMLARDFIEDSLYNHNYGYFPKQATIFDAPDASLDFPVMRDSVEFQEEVAGRYAAYRADKHDGPGRQLWHTPTELFKVRYIQSIDNHDALTLGEIALVRTCNCPVPRIRVLAEIFPIRGLRHL